MSECDLSAPTLPATAPLEVGASIGCYKLIQQVATDVFLAETHESVPRQVRLHCLAAPTATFEAEWRALAALDHVNIAKVLDGGVLPSGCAYLVSEPVEGIPLTRYCDKEQVSLAERLALFTTVCAAVEHARQRGIRHHNLKAATILIAMVGRKPTVKMIDLGLPPHTATGTQDPDIFSLGMLLCELATGSAPSPADRLRPSALLAGVQELPNIAGRRKLTPRKLLRALRGDLDWIVLQCVGQAPGPHYTTVHEVAQDVRRFLAQEPVLARPRSTVYRLRKFTQRHRRKVVAAGVLALALVCGLVGATVGPELVTALFQQRADGDRDEREALANLNSLGVQYCDAGKYDLAVPLFERALAGRQRVLGPDHADTQLTMSNLALAYRLAGKFKEALPLQEQLLEKRQATLGPNHAITVATIFEMARTLQSLGKHDKAIAMFAEALHRRQATLGADDMTTLLTMHWLALAYQHGGKLDLAVPVFLELVDHYKRSLDPNHNDLLIAMNNLGQAYRAWGKYDKAAPILEEVYYRRLNKLGKDHADTFLSLQILVLTYQSAGRHQDALPLWEKVAEKKMAEGGPENPNTLAARFNVADACTATGKYQQAEQILNDILLSCEKLYGPHPGSTLVVLERLADLHERTRHFAGAEADWRALLIRYRRNQNNPNAQRDRALVEVGAMLLKQKKYADAEPFLRASWILRQQLRPGVWQTANSQSLLGAALSGQRRYGSAEGLLLAGYDGMRARGVPNDRLAEAAQRLVQLYEAWQRPGPAARWRQVLRTLHNSRRY